MGINVKEIESGVSADIVKIKLNDFGDYTAISPDDDSLFERFMESDEKVQKVADQFKADIEELEKKKDSVGEKEKDLITAEMIRKKREFSQEIAKCADYIFGDGTVRRLFEEIFEEIPTFVPSGESITTFLDSVAPQIKEVFSEKMKSREKESMARIDKYQPQDHKKSQKKV